MNVKKHLCGCVTIKKGIKITFTKMCPKHQKNKQYHWIALQHENEEIK